MEGFGLACMYHLSRAYNHVGKDQEKTLHHSKRAALFLLLVFACIAVLAIMVAL